MSGLATAVLTGDAAYLVAVQAELLTSSNGRDIYRLKTPDLRIGVYDGPSRKLVIFDGPALVAVTMAELAEPAAPEKPLMTMADGRAPTAKDAKRVAEVVERRLRPVVIDPPSRL
ncbi:hypothetical protein ACFPPA_05805 [Rhodanobacter ginsengisoli]|uniref:Transposase n=1 Tax=Rhodanobacter ginsengisoli TaxID=418646 RepID=A0ABW0QJX1_9GAMM